MFKKLNQPKNPSESLILQGQVTKQFLYLVLCYLLYNVILSYSKCNNLTKFKRQQFSMKAVCRDI